MAHDDLLHQIGQLVEQLPDEELDRVMEFLNAEYRNRLRRAAQRAALTLRPGDWVQRCCPLPGRRLARGARGRVVHVARSRVHVDFSEQGIWALLPTGLQKIELSAAEEIPPALGERG